MENERELYSTEKLAARLSEIKDGCEKDDDRKALEAAISFLDAANDGGVTDELDFKDLLFDYGLSAEENDRMRRKFLTAAKVVNKNGVFLCPACGHRVGAMHTHCHWCGKRLGGW